MSSHSTRTPVAPRLFDIVRTFLIYWMLGGAPLRSRWTILCWGTYTGVLLTVLSFKTRFLVKVFQLHCDFIVPFGSLELWYPGPYRHLCHFPHCHPCLLYPGGKCALSDHLASAPLHTSPCAIDHFWIFALKHVYNCYQTFLCWFEKEVRLGMQTMYLHAVFWRHELHSVNVVLTHMAGLLVMYVPSVSTHKE